jgi:hypothetical protein
VHGEQIGKLGIAKMSGKIKTHKMILSPYGATLFPLLLLFMSFIFPPSLYEHYVNEPDYMFLNFKMLAFGLLCVFFYYIGISISNYRPIFNFRLTKKKIKLSIFSYLGLILVIVILLQLLSIFLVFVYFYKAVYLNLLEIFISGKGQLIKDYLGTEVRIPFGLGALPSFIIGIKFWLLYKWYAFQAELSHLSKGEYFKLRIIILLSITLFIISNIILVNRPLLMIFLLGWFLIYSYFNKGSIFRRIVKLSIIIVLIFIIVQIFRSAGVDSYENFDELVLGRLLGYTIADFNRFALMIEGKLSYVDAGISRIFYILPVLKIPLTNVAFFDLREYASLALSAVGNAGLNSSLNMATLFGGIYQSIGMATPLYFTVLGFIGNRLYISFKNGKTFGIIFYPLFYASVALWMIDVNIFFMYFLYFFYSFIFVVLYEAFVNIKGGCRLNE